MFKKIIYTIGIFFFSITPTLSDTNIYIVTTINDEIITNYDIQKEIEYLQILNKDLKELDKIKKIEIAKESLINEVIKEKEIKKKFDLNKKNLFEDEYLKNFYSILNVDNESDFKNALLLKENYSLEEIKKKIKIEVLWNELIYTKYINQVKIDKDKLIERVNNLSNKTQKEFFLSEIVFQKNQNENLNELINKINLSISEIGFNNTANIYSISESSKLGGKLGWISENNLSKLIFDELKKINVGEYTKIIKNKNIYMILKIEETRNKVLSMNKNDELDKMVNHETNKQLNQFSRIYFDKLKINFNINEN